MITTKHHGVWLKDSCSGPQILIFTMPTPVLAIFFNANIISFLAYYSLREGAYKYFAAF